MICTYDKNGNLIHVAVDRGFAHTYSYTAFSLPKAQADKVQTQQSDLLDHFFLWMPNEPEPPQAIHYMLNEYLPKQEDLYPHMGEAFLE